MAGQKQYEMLYKLSANLNSSFSSTFKNAQTALTDTQQKLQSLAQSQADISAYEKQQAAIEKTRAKLELLQNKLQNVEQEYIATGSQSSTLANKMLDYEASVNKTSSALDKQESELREMEGALEEAGVDTKNLESESDRLEKEMEELKDAEEDAGEGAEEFGDKSQAAFQAAAAALGSAAMKKALQEIYEAFKVCVEAAAGFEAEMSNVEALSGATGQELEQLSQMAKDMGAQTSFSAQESASAFSYMALAGWDTQQMLAGIEPVLNLAAAANMDLAQASDIVTDYLTAFGLTAEDTTGFVDQMAYAMAHSNTNVIQLGEAYKSCAATASSMGYAVEDVTAVLMTMANAGVKGGEAGTALNAIMTRLATDTKGCASALEEYGVHVYDAQGNMQSLSSILTGMANVWGQLTDQEQAAMAKTIAGTSQYSKLQTIMAGCSDSAAEAGQSFADYAAALEDCAGSAGQMANTMLDNMNGSLTIMQSALEGLTIAVGENFTPVMSKLYDVLAEVFSGLTSFVNEHPALVNAITAGAAAFAVITGAVLAFTAAEKLATAAGLELMAAMPVLAVISGVAIGIGALVGVITSLASESETAAEAMARLSGTIESADATEGLVTQYRQLSEDLNDSSLSAEELANKQAELAGVTEQLKAAYPELLGNIDAGTKAWDLQLQAIQATAEAERAAAMVEFNNNAAESIQGLLELQQTYEDAEAAYAQAQENMSQGIDLDVDATISQVQALKDELQEKIEAGEIYFDDQEYLDGIEQLDAALTQLTGREVHIEGLSDVDSYLQMIGSGALDTSDKMQGLSQSVADAAGDVASSYQALNASQMMFQSFLDSGMVTMDGLRTMSGNAALSITDLGITSEQVGEKVATGALTMEEAMTRYGMSEEAVSRAVRGYENAQIMAAAAAEAATDATDEGTDANEKSYRKMLQLQFASQMVEDGLMGAERAAQAYGLSIDELNAYMDEQTDASDALSAAAAAVESNMMRAEVAAERFGVSLDDTKVQVFEDALGNLITKYDEVYRAAYESFSSQFDLWEKVDATAATSLSDLQSAIDSQIAYWNNYNANLQVLQEHGLDTTGIWDHITDGSTEAAAAAQGLADALNSGDTSAVDAYIASYENLQEATGGAAETVAGASEEVQQAFADMWDAFSEGAENANLSEQMCQAAVDTIQGYIDGLGDGSDVNNQLEQIANSAMDTFKAGVGTHSPSTITDQAGKDTIQGYVNGVNAKAADAMAALQNAAQQSIAAFQALMNANTFYAAGQNAMQGAINGINSMIPALVAAARNAGTQAANAYKAAQDINSPSKLFEWFSEMDMLGAIKGIEENQEKVNAAFAQSASGSAEAYQRAVADQSAIMAAPGVATGLSAAEADTSYLVYADVIGALKQAGKPVNAEEAIPFASSFGGGGIVVNFAPVYNLSGATSGAEVRAVLAAHDADMMDELRAMIADVIDEREMDARRRAFK